MAVFAGGWGARMWLARVAAAVVLGLTATPLAGAEPETRWQDIDAREPWVARATDATRAYAEARQPTAVMVVQDGRVVAQWGDVARKVNMRSVRKSLLSTLYGFAVAEGRIKLDSTVGELGIDDKPPALTEVEKRATVRDLLMARSGIYHASAYESSDMAKRRPERGSHAPGTSWYYNNWDFNALGTIYRHATREDIFESFHRRIAKPIGMEDFWPIDGEYVREPSSEHVAYPFSLTARDAARFGVLVANGGVWNGRQIVPAGWLKEATQAYSQTNFSDSGYGYCWWVVLDGRLGAGAVMALGYGGQVIAVMPAKRLVVVQTLERVLNPRPPDAPDLLGFLDALFAIVP
jgi:CubicO group peptidase (beta-lactamase class C family)